MNYKRLLVGSVLGAATLASPAAFAGATGNVGAVSEYMFRGLQQNTNDASIQGGLDYAFDSGLYLGTWGSNVDWGAGGSEIDLYGGFTTKLSDAIGIDVGAIFYYYPEVDEVNEDLDANTVEFYAGLILGPITVKYFYSPSYFGLKEADGDDAKNSYIVGSAAFPIGTGLNLTASVGYTKSSDDVWLDGVDGLTGDKALDDYIDYSAGLSKAIDDTMTATFQIIGTDFKDDDPGLVIGLKKTFAL
jgi:uncharacterized protein (TIGR02001 family)